MPRYFRFFAREAAGDIDGARAVLMLRAAIHDILPCCLRALCCLCFTLMPYAAATFSPASAFMLAAAMLHAATLDYAFSPIRHALRYIFDVTAELLCCLRVITLLPLLRRQQAMPYATICQLFRLPLIRRHAAAIAATMLIISLYCCQRHYYALFRYFAPLACRRRYAALRLRLLEFDIKMFSSFSLADVLISA